MVFIKIFFKSWSFLIIGVLINGVYMIYISNRFYGSCYIIVSFWFLIFMVLFGDVFYNFVDGLVIGVVFIESVFVGIVIIIIVFCYEFLYELGNKY